MKSSHSKHIILIFTMQKLRSLLIAPSSRPNIISFHVALLTHPQHNIVNCHKGNLFDQKLSVHFIVLMSSILVCMVTDFSPVLWTLILTGSQVLFKVATEVSLERNFTLLFEIRVFAQRIYFLCVQSLL